MEIILKKDFNGTFSPVDCLSEETAKKLKIGKEYKFKVTGIRNLKFHKKFFALIKTVFENQEQFVNIEEMRKALIFDAGFREQRQNLKGEIIQYPKSISFSKMDEIEFEELYNKVIDIVILWLGWNRQEFINHLIKYT